MEGIKQHKQACLLAEHGGLSAYVEQEVVATALARSLACASWLIAMFTAFSAGLDWYVVLVAVLVTTGALWLLDVYVSYVGVVYKMRRLKVRAWLDEWPQASDELVAGWTTPANPFDGLSRSDKMSALKDALTSPAVFVVYAVLEVGTVVLLVVA